MQKFKTKSGIVEKMCNTWQNKNNNIYQWFYHCYERYFYFIHFNEWIFTWR